jgi:hypothetical protein
MYLSPGHVAVNVKVRAAREKTNFDLQMPRYGPGGPLSYSSPGSGGFWREERKRLCRRP